MRDESSASNADVATVPSQFKVTKQILLHWQSFRDLKLKYVGSRQEEKLARAHSSVWWLPFRTLYFGRRWLALSLRKRMSPSVSSSSSR